MLAGVAYELDAGIQRCQPMNLPLLKACDRQRDQESGCPNMNHLSHHSGWTCLLQAQAVGDRQEVGSIGESASVNVPALHKLNTDLVKLAH